MLIILELLIFTFSIYRTKGRGIMMKRKGISILCIVLSIIILQINNGTSNAQEKFNIFDEILLQTNSKTMEYGLTTVFNTREDQEQICNYLINNLKLNGKAVKLNISKNSNSYCIDFSGINIQGYIEAIKNNDSNNIKINISRISDENGLIPLKSKVSASINTRGKNIEYFQYLKAKIGTGSANVKIKDIYSINEMILKILRSHGTKNIETVRLNNGLSTVAYTGQYDEKVINNRLIDFNYAVCNYAVCNYSSGNYIVIGTPEIITTY